MNNLSFDELPEAVAEVHVQLTEIRDILLQKSKSPSEPQDELLTVLDVAQFLSISVPTVYGLISKGELPVMMRQSAVISQN